MATDSRAFGNYMFPHVAWEPPPGAQIVAYVRSGGWLPSDTGIESSMLVSDLNTALKYCRSGSNDIVVVLPGHTENISSADAMSNLVAGTQIIGIGDGQSRPQFTWSAAAATFLLDVANVTITNCIFYMAGDPTGSTAITVAAPMTVSAAGCSLRGCKIQTSVDADQLSTIAITTTAAADDFTISDCDIYGLGDGTGVTTVIRAVGADRLRIHNTNIDAYTSSTTVGVLQFLTTASINVRVTESTFTNRKASSVHAVTGMAGTLGVFKSCGFGILDNATLAGLAGTHGFQMFNCHTANLAGENGAASTPVSV